MKRLIWLPSFNCNYACPYCYVRKFPPSKPRPMEDWKKIFDGQSKSWIDISGGEPFLYPKFVDLINHLSERHIVSVTTNLSFPESLNKLMPKLYGITVSFHPHIVSIQDFLSKIKPHLNLCVNIVAYPEIIFDLPLWLSKFRQAGIKTHVEPYISHETNYSESEKAIVSSLSKTRSIGWINEMPPRKCDAGIVSEYWLPNGDIYTCYTAHYWESFVKPVSENHRLGNLFDGTYNPRKEEFTCEIPCIMGCDFDTRADIWKIFRERTK